MSIRRFSTASISTGNSKSTKLWDQETFQSGMFALATISLTSSASSVVFSDIPQNYTHLQIRFIARNNRAVNWDSLSLRFNGDTASNYAYHLLVGEGSGSGSTVGLANQSAIAASYQTGSSAGASIFSGGVIDILDYANINKSKTVRSLSGNDLNGSGAILFGSGLWINTASAITSISLFSTSVSFIENSSFALYGIKAG